MSIVIAIFGVLLGVTFGNQLGLAITSFIRPKGLWNLVPLRCSGWKSCIYPNRIYRLRWIWGNLDFKDYVEFK